MFCGECKKECSPTIVDFGIGPYEFWGGKFVDTNEQIVSDCCEAEIFEDEECTIEADCRDAFDEDQPILGDG